MAEKGVPLGVGTELPRTPLIFEEKVKWPLDEVEGDIEKEEEDVRFRANYSSVDDSIEAVMRNVSKDLITGDIVKLPLKEAKEKFGNRLAIASLGTVRKEAGSEEVGIIYDATH